jgi:thymidylate synthase
MGLYPCAYSMTFNVEGDRLNGILNQRSNDMLTANNWNVVQYAILIMMFAQVSGLKPGKLIHVIADAHIYDRHIPLVKKVIAKPQHKAPKLVMNPDVKNFYDFKVEDFQLIDYEYEILEEKIPVAI